jgi:hypothetical protein
MVIYRFIPLVISWILISAQNYMNGNKLLMIGSVVVPMLLLVMRRPVLLFVQWATFFGTIVWIRAGVHYISYIIDPNGNYFMVVIFFSILSLGTVASGLLLYDDNIRRLYRL